MRKEIVVRNNKTEITVNGGAISVSTPDVLATIMTDGESASVTTFTKDEIVSQIL